MILDIINKLIKYIIIVLFKERYLVEQLIYIIPNRLEGNYRIAVIIILDRDKLFTLNFQKGLNRRLDIKLRILTIYFLEINE